MTNEPRCRSCLHLWRWHHVPGRTDAPGTCSRCSCTVWQQPIGGMDPRDEAREARELERAIRAERAAYKAALRAAHAFEINERRLAPPVQ